MSARAAPDVVVVGAGAIGCGVARSLALRGAYVIVIERGEPGCGATRAAGGMLSPVAEAGEPGPFLELALRSFDAFPAYAAALRDESGVDPEYRRGGKLRVALNDVEAARLAEAHAWRRAAGLDVRWLDGAAARDLEPRLSGGVVAALDIEADHQVNSRAFGQACWRAAERAGASFRLGTPAERVLVEHDRVCGIQLTDGSRVRAGVVVLAAGAWTGDVQGLPQPLPVRPVFGEIVALSPGWAGGRVIAGEDCYMVPRADGRLLIGATMEETGFREAPTAGGASRLLTAALRIIPALAAATLDDVWSGLRPGTPDDLPVLGPDPALPGLHYATGHFRNGILLTPVTAELVTALIAGDPPPLDPTPFSVARFVAAAALRAPLT